MIRITKTLATALVLAALVLPLHAAEKGTPVDLNNATLEELVKLPRIGPAVAKRVIEFRKENGGFHRVEELRNVRGIGPKSFELLREMVTVGAESAKPAGAKAAAKSATK